MINNRSFFLGLIMLNLTAFCAAQKPAYSLYNESGKESMYNNLLDSCASADIILFGELHNNPISHWLEFELTKDLYSKLGTRLVLGAEMFETDGQLIMDEYFTAYLTDKKFEDEMRLWNNYDTDYKPLLEFARDSGLRFIATNIPRRYANIVYNLGLDTLDFLSKEAKKYMMPLPLKYDTTLNCYASLAGGGPMGGHGSANLRDAQAVKDATMAHFILSNYRKNEIFIHFNGAYHSDNFESLYYFLKKAKPKLNIITISTVSQQSIEKLEEENKGKANFIICVPESMTTTY